MEIPNASGLPAAAAMRINVRPLGNPLPLGLFSFGIGMLLLAAQTAGWVAESDATQIGLVLAAFVFPLEGLATIMAFLARDTLAATVFGLFTTSWLTLGLTLLVARPGATSHTLGFFLLGFAAAVASLAAAAVAGKPLIAVLLSLSATRALLDGLFQLTRSTSTEHAAGSVAAAIAGVAWYAGTAFLLEDLRQSALLPVFRRGAGQAALEGDPAEQLSRAEGGGRGPAAALDSRANVGGA